MSSSPHFWPELPLNNGTKMPSVGLGTFLMKDRDDVYNAVDTALAAGYRLFDTASVYGNETYLNSSFKELLPKYNLTRENIFITSKLSNSELGSAEKAKRAYRKSLDRLGVDYIDLYLIHYPGAASLGSYDERNRTMRNESWTGLVELYETKQVKSIGVSNFTEKHIENLMEKHDVLPAVNQVEFHPYYNNSDLLHYCQKRGILLQAYHSFGGAAGKGQLLQHPEVIAIAQHLGATPAQVLLVWALQKGIAVIPKARTPDHIKSNINLGMRLTPEQTKVLDSVDKTKKFAWDPSLIV